MGKNIILLLSSILLSCSKPELIPVDPLTGLYTVDKFVNNIDCSTHNVQPEYSNIDLVYLEKQDDIINITICTDTCLEHLWTFSYEYQWNSIDIWTDYDRYLCRKDITVRWLDIGYTSLKINQFNYQTDWHEDACEDKYLVPTTCRQTIYILQPTNIWALDTGDL